jgi:hypothetical protein
MSTRTSDAESQSSGVRRAASGLVLGLLGGILFTTVGASAGPAAIGQIPASFPGGPHFVLSCGFSHRNNDDPIVFPGQPGRSHNHTYVGNFSVNAATTPDALLGGRSSCDFEADASAYWAPTLYMGRHAAHAGGHAVLPIAGFAYYVKRTATRVAPHPAGFRMIAGNAAARRPQRPGIAAWSCSELGRGPRYAVIPACAQDRLVQVQITFPNCWNGTSVDSADHKRHMAYASGGMCPASHPVALPTIVLILIYPELRGPAQVSSGRFAIHADFMNGWHQATLQTLVAQLNQA